MLHRSQRSAAALSSSLAWIYRPSFAHCRTQGGSHRQLLEGGANVYSETAEWLVSLRDRRSRLHLEGGSLQHTGCRHYPSRQCTETGFVSTSHLRGDSHHAHQL